MKWIKHDSTANQDAKLKRLRMKYGLEGYGLYWYCLELIAAEVDQNKLTFELEHDAEIISFDTGIHYERVQEMMTYMVKLKLFEQNNGAITCMKLAKRLDKSMTSNPVMRKMIEEIRKNHDSVMTLSDEVMQDKTRLDEIRVDKKETISPEQSSEPAIMLFPTKSRTADKKSKKEYPVTQTIIDELTQAYPELDIIIQLHKSKLWLGSNNTRLKTYNGMKKFITGWMGRAKPDQADYSNIPINKIVSEYNRLVAHYYGYSVDAISDQLKTNIAKVWNGSESAQDLGWWIGIFSMMCNKLNPLEQHEIKFNPHYRLENFVGSAFMDNLNRLNGS